MAREPREQGVDFLSVDGHVAVDQQPYVKAVVNGSKEISRDLLEGAESILDPKGDRLFWHEVESGGFDEFRMCSASIHKGERWLPKAEFTTDASTPTHLDRFCSRCRREYNFQARVKQAERENRQLREKPGRPTKLNS